MAGVNKVILLGRTGQKPEVRRLESGSVVAKLNLATTETYKDKNGNRIDNTEWHDVEIWDGLAKVVEQYVKKGDMIYIEGKIKTDKWEDKEGNPRKTVKIRAINMTMLSKGNSAEQQSQDDNMNADDNSDLPF